MVIEINGMQYAIHKEWSCRLWIVDWLTGWLVGYGSAFVFFKFQSISYWHPHSYWIWIWIGNVIGIGIACACTFTCAFSFAYLLRKFSYLSFALLYYYTVQYTMILVLVSHQVWFSHVEKKKGDPNLSFFYILSLYKRSKTESVRADMHKYQVNQ